MGCTIGIKSLIKTKQQDEKLSRFIRNGSALLEELIAMSNGQYIISMRNFTAEELVRATNNFRECIARDQYGGMFRGYFEERPILVKKWKNPINYSLEELAAAVRDTTIASLMSHLKNVLKLVGCCLEFEYPALVYEYPGSTLLMDFFRDSCNNDRVLSWKSRTKIASDIASMIVYLHTAFPTPVIHRDLKPSTVIIDQHGVAKLFDFSFTVVLPPGESQVEDDVFGTPGFLDFEYYRSNIVTERTDVYSFGILLLMFITGKSAVCENDKGEPVIIARYVQQNVHGDQLDKIVDPKIVQEVGESELQAFLDLAMRCTKEKGEDRPDITYVAKELHLIKKSVCN